MEDVTEAAVQWLAKHIETRWKWPPRVAAELAEELDAKARENGWPVESIIDWLDRAAERFRVHQRQCRHKGPRC